MSKAFEKSGTICKIIPATLIGHPEKGRIWLSVNGEIKKDGDLGQMPCSVAEVIANLSGYVCLTPGDLIFTETPAGVSTIAVGDEVKCGIEGVENLLTRIV